MAGALAGSVETIVNCPFETLKVRMQSPDHLYRYSGAINCFWQVINFEGISGVYRGFEPHLLRNASWNGIYFGFIGLLHKSDVIPPALLQNKSMDLFASFIIGTIGGACGTLLNTPFDVVKSRMQNQRANTAITYHWTLPTLWHIAQTEGGKVLWRGLGARLVRLGPGGGIMIVSFDVVSGWLL